MSPRFPRLRSAARSLSRSIWLLASVILAGMIVLLVWSRVVTPAENSARFSLDSDEAVMVSRDPWITFQPRDIDPVTGVIFYPAARADPAAYAPMLHALAARGFLVVLTRMPLNVATFAPERASRVMTRFAGVRHWVIAGHGLGGVAAATFAARHEQELAGLVLWGSSPGPFTDLSSSGIAVLAIPATPADAERAHHRLPEATTFLSLKAADPWGFGNFAVARPAGLMSRDEQQSMVLEGTQSFLERASGGREQPEDGS